MLKNNILLYSIMFYLTAMPVGAIDLTLSDLTLPQPPAYRVGLSEIPEKQYIQAEENLNKPEQSFAKIGEYPEGNVADVTYADLSIKRLSKEISQELAYEEKDMVADLSLLWQGAATQSDTINFALYKLANPDADKPDEKSIKKVLTTIASMSTLVGAGLGNPLLAGSSMIGGNILGIMSQDTKALNYKYTKVGDADMIILIRKVEDLQQKAVDLYYDYMSAKKNLEFMNDLVEERQRKFELAQTNNAARELIVITDAYYRTALDKQRSAKSEFFAKRAALEQFVGNETFIQFEAELAERDKSEKNVDSVDNVLDLTSEQNEDYKDTIRNVENYTNSLAPNNYQSYDSVLKEPQNIAVEDENPYLYEKDYTQKLYSNTLPDIRLPEEGGFYSDFPTGFASPTTLAEFLATGDNVPKEKKYKEPKDSKVKTKKDKIKKEKPKKEKVSEHDISRSSDDEPVLEIPVKTKKIRQKKEKPQKYKSNPDIENSIEVNALSELGEKKVKEKKVKEKKVREKRVKDNTEYAYGQPLKKYPRNSTKDLIFLHGQDKHSVKSAAQQQTQQINELQNKEVKPVMIDTSDLLPLDNVPISIERKINQPLNDSGLLPLDDIRIPELSRGGYSIHSEY